MGTLGEPDAGALLRAVAEALAIPLVYPLAALAEWAKLAGLLPVLFRMP